MTKYISKFTRTQIAALSVLIAAVMFIVSSSSVLGLFRYIGADFRATGTVSAKGASSLQLVTSGSTWTINVLTSGTTTYTDGLSSFAAITVGQRIKVYATQANGDFMASQISDATASSVYGNPLPDCESFMISTTIFERPVNNTIYVVKDGIGFKVEKTSGMTVVGGTYDDIVPGSEIAIEGYDCRSDAKLYAEKITIVKNEALDKCNNYGIANLIKNRRVLMINDLESARSQVYNVNFPAGTYDVFGVSFDNHTMGNFDKQTDESWKVVAYNGNDIVYTSDATDDLPDNLDTNSTKIGSNVNIPTDITGIQFVHKQAPNSVAIYQSVFPVCAAFVPAE